LDVLQLAGPDELLHSSDVNTEVARRVVLGQRFRRDRRDRRLQTHFKNRCDPFEGQGDPFKDIF
jgi:hypothetical protein